MNTLYKAFFATLLMSVLVTAAPCTDIKNPVEKMICKSADLAALQEKLDSVYKEAIKKSETAQIERLKREHSKWRSRRDQCDTSDCVHSQIMNRITALDQYVKN